MSMKLTAIWQSKKPRELRAFETVAGLHHQHPHNLPGEATFHTSLPHPISGPCSVTMGRWGLLRSVLSGAIFRFQFLNDYR